MKTKTIHVQIPSNIAKNPQAQQRVVSEIRLGLSTVSNAVVAVSPRCRGIDGRRALAKQLMALGMTQDEAKRLGYATAMPPEEPAPQMPAPLATYEVDELEA